MDHNSAIKRLSPSSEPSKRHRIFTEAVGEVDKLNKHSLAAIGKDAAFVATLDSTALKGLVEHLAVALSVEIGANEELRYGDDL